MISKLKIVAKCIHLVVRYTLLIIPLIWFSALWIEALWGYRIYKLFDLGVLFFLFGTPTIFFIGAIYTAHKKMWGWFAAYMGLAGLPYLAYIITEIIR